MEVVGFALALGLLAAVVTGGRVERLLDVPLRWPFLAAGAFAIQLALGLWRPPGGWPAAAAVALYVASLLMLVWFCAGNVHLTGMSVVLVGIALNLAVVVVNGAMPVRLAADATEDQRRAVASSATHQLEDDARALAVLGEIVPLPEPFDRRVSFGDLIVGMGIVDVVFRASRARARPPVTASRVAPVSGADGQPGAAQHHLLERSHDTTVVDASR